MDSLAELGERMGLTRDAVDLARYGGPHSTALGMAGLLVTTLADPDRRSLRTLLDVVPTLPPITLDARLTGPRTGSGGLLVTAYRVSGCPGAVWHTAVEATDYTGRTVVGPELGAAAGEHELQLGPGRTEVVVRRTGLSAHGPVQLLVPLGRVEVAARQDPPPPDDPPDPPPAPAGPVLVVEADPAVPVSDATVGLRAHGGGFAGGEPVEIRLDGAAQTQTVSNALGGYAVTFSVVRARPPTSRTLTAVGLVSGATASAG